MCSLHITLRAMLVVLTLLCSIAQAVSLTKQRSFSLSQDEHGRYIKNGPGEIVRAYRRYGVPVPDGLLALAEARAEEIAIACENPPAKNEPVPAIPSDEWDLMYLTPITIGNNTLNFLLDTGSADLWAYSSLQAFAELDGHAYYHTASGTKLNNYTFDIIYADGSAASGDVYVDRVAAGSTAFPNQTFGAATDVNARMLRDGKLDGILGLSFSVLNTIKPNPQKTFFDNIKAGLSEPVFAVALKYHAPGAYDFGFIDKTKYEGEIAWVDADSSQGFWGFAATAFSIGNTKNIAANIDIVADTGTSDTFLPTAICETYYSEIPGANNTNFAEIWLLPCEATMPDFSLTIGGAKFVFPGEQLMDNPVESGSSSCIGGIQDDMGWGSVMGDNFLKSLYVVHEDRSGQDARPRMGFAKQVA